MKGIIGYYNEGHYSVRIVENGEIVQLMYIAGNCKYDSQQYVSAENGVGLEKMKEFCEYTSSNIAIEENLPYLGVEYEEYVEV